MKQLFEMVMAPATGWADEVKAGQRTRVTDLEGLQVVDMAVFNAANLREKLSTSNSRTRAGIKRPGEGDDFHLRDRLFEGEVLMSTINNEMMRITTDTADVKGMHDVHGRMCNRHLYAAMGEPGKDGCHEIISGVVTKWDLRPEDIPDSTMKQMAAYVAALEIIYPGRRVEAGVLYTQTPQLFALPAQRLAAYKSAFAAPQESYALPPVE